MSERKRVNYRSVDVQLDGLHYWEKRNQARADAGILNTDQRGNAAHVDPAFDDVGFTLPRDIHDSIRDNRDDSRTRW
ncbi:hypothetical protein A2841_00410 [Candidatus Kaiserbacteria bacterium RIFCSPHIGHO2_01_FULL_48_10]|uniref:Uncharacterized protein n=1 Tax=Candidatus Kaiserbacteria bacterium RIFCSPHIGHO2_01_FULL_48_10 TaxID=1798476 RepID=A0A1F6C5P2_9BACT|nr:MAG: hypothetical protein A2841_00410 [Candidatus Kaiserbacteria bacterium RIFCSPHIGHO2_01_FULL_48_10]